MFSQRGHPRPNYSWPRCGLEQLAHYNHNWFFLLCCSFSSGIRVFFFFTPLPALFWGCLPAACEVLWILLITIIRGIRIIVFHTVLFVSLSLSFLILLRFVKVTAELAAEGAFLLEEQLDSSVNFTSHLLARFLLPWGRSCQNREAMVIFPFDKDPYLDVW